MGAAAQTRPSDELAVLFPGQGVGDPAAAELVRARLPELLELAGELAGADPFERIADGTRYAQPAIYCASLAGFEELGRPEALAFAGHSLGEIAALAAAGAVDPSDGLRIAAERGRLMSEAAEAAGPAACSPSAAIATRRSSSPSTRGSRSRTRTRPSSSCSAARRRHSSWRARRRAAAACGSSARGRRSLPFDRHGAAVEPFAEHLAGVEFDQPRRR